MSDHPQGARFSRLDPIRWPPGTAVVLFLGWLAYAILCTLWVHPLLWTVLPAGLTLYLFAERYPWPVIIVLVAPVALLTAISQVLASSSETPTEVAFGVYLVACSYFSFIVLMPDRDGWVARLPDSLLGGRFSARLAWVRFEESLIAANGMVRQVEASDEQGTRGAAMHRLASAARDEAERGDVWRDAWAALGEWLDAVSALVGVDPTADQVRHVHELLVGLDEAHMRAIERTAVLDPAP